MQAITKAEYELDKEKIIARIRAGEIFIYPTDTIYGIGCDATNNAAVEKIRRIKGNMQRPFSVMVEGREWIEENCDLTSIEEEWLDKLPGPYTLILAMKNKACVAESVTNTVMIGVRIPAHWCTELSRLAKVPIITTSANISGGLFMTSLENLNDEVKKHVDFMIEDGKIQGRPSTIVSMGKVLER